MILIGSIALVVILAAIIIPVSIHSRKQARYDEGKDLLDKRDFAAAAEIFDSLEGFGDAADKADYARQGLAYENAMDLYEAEDYTAAENAFKALSGLRMRITCRKCRNAMDYAIAMALFKAGDYGACKLFQVPAL